MNDTEFEFKLKFFVAGEIRRKQEIAGGNKQVAKSSSRFIILFYSVFIK
jgi:hypothetical protein